MGGDESELRVAWARCVGDQEHLDALLARHREPHRRYHGIRHIVWVIRHVDELANFEPTDDLPAVFAAAFYHDAVYDPTASDNEHASAQLASSHLHELGWAADRIDHVVSMILATGRHVDSAPAAHADADAAVLVDADLAVLGADPGAYQAYVNGIRAEYAHLDDHDWRAGRRSVVEALLERDPLYLTPTAHARWDARARANLHSELATLVTTP